MFNNYESFNLAKKNCNICSVGKVYNKVVCSDGNVENPTVIIIGECPGSDEIDQGIPFVGKAGKFLRSTLNEFGFRTTNSLISNVMPCRPENNKFPKDDDLVKSCFNKWLKIEISLTNPKYLLLVGAQPLKFVLGLNGITKIRGKWCLFANNGMSIHVMPTFHPSYVLRKMHMENGKKIVEEFKSDIKALAISAGFLF